MKIKVSYFLILALALSSVLMTGVTVSAKKPLWCEKEFDFYAEEPTVRGLISGGIDGIFVCGSAHWPADIRESISQANAAASRASTIISKDMIEVEGSTAEVDSEICIGCGVCIKLCPYSAISKNEENVVFVNKVLCKACGVCGASCLVNAITIHHFTNDQILSEINTCTEE